MKRFLLFSLLFIALLGGLFAYYLYTQGAFEKRKSVEGDLKPFQMKCEAGKCGAGKCGGAQ